MKSVAFLLAGIAALTLTLASGTIHGHLTNRWGAPPDLEAAGQRVESLPTSFGDWELVSEQDLDDDALRLLQCTGYVHHVYRNSKHPSWPVVQVAVLVGPAGPISVHTPEICYSSRDYLMTDPRRHLQVQLPGDPAEHVFWGMTLQPTDRSQPNLRVCYGWSVGNEWQAPEHPRFRYGAERVLYKIQLAQEQLIGESGAASESHFLREFLPVLNQWLFASAGQPSRS